MKKKGFTLIELLAVIVILSIIALITIPVMLNIIENTKEGAFKAGVYSLFDAYEYKEIDSNFDGIGELDIIKGDCSNLDSTAPVINNISIEKTTSSINVIVSFSEPDSFIESYEFRLLDNNNNEVVGWETGDTLTGSGNNRVTTKTYTGLTQNTTYKVEVKITNTSDSENNSVTDNETVTLNSFNTPEISYNTSDYEINKIVTLTYDMGVTTRYKIVDNDLNTIVAWTTLNNTSETITISNYDYTVIIESSDGTTTLSNSSVIGYIDYTKPNINISNVDSNWNTSDEVIMTMTDNISGVNKWCITNINSSEGCTWNNITPTTNTSINHTITSNGNYYVFVGDLSGNISNSYELEITKVDTTAPTGVNVTVTGTATKSISVQASGNEDISGITKYEFSKDNGSTWVDNGIETNYTFDNLTSGSYIITVRVTNGAGLTSTNTTPSTQTVAMTAPILVVNTTGWATSKTVTITYPEGFTNYYSIDGGENWTSVTGNSKELTITTTGTEVSARIYDGTNYLSSDTLTINNIDKYRPSVIVNNISNSWAQTDEVTLNITDTGMGVNKWCVTTSNNSNNCTWNGIEISTNTSINHIIISNGTYYAFVKDGANLISNSYQFIVSYIDTTNPTLSLTKDSYIEGFNGWDYSGGAYESNGIVYLANASGSIAYPPYYKADQAEWKIDFDYYVTQPSPLYAPQGGIHMGVSYYNQNLINIVAPNNNYSSNGWAPQTTLNTWTNTGSSYGSYGNGETVYYIKWIMYTGSQYSTGPAQLKNFKFYGQVYSTFYDIHVIKSDANSGIKQVKYANGSKAISYFESSGIVASTDTIRVTDNGTYTIYVEDNAGNKTISTITINKIDKTIPTVNLITTVNDTSTSQSFVLNANTNANTSGYIYYWYKNGTKVATTTTPTYTVNGTGTYKVKVIAGNGKVAEASTVINTYTTSTVSGKSYLTVMGTKDNGSTCILKGKYANSTKEIPYDSNNCTLAVANNLFKNGDLEYKSNIYWDSFQYDSNNKNLYINGRATLYSSDYIEIDKSKTYRETITIKSNNTSTIHYLGLAEFDCRYNAVTASTIMYISGSTTTLASDLKNGDTIVYLNNANGFSVNSSTPSHQLGLIFWNYEDCNGNNYGTEIYSQNVWHNLFTYNNVNKSNNTITLNRPWSNGTIVAGTQVSQSNSGGTYNYGMHVGTVTSSYQTFTNTLTGTQFRPGTKYAKLLGLYNHNNTPNTITYVKQATFEVVE